MKPLNPSSCFFQKGDTTASVTKTFSLRRNLGLAVKREGKNFAGSIKCLLSDFRSGGKCR